MPRQKQVKEKEKAKDGKLPKEIEKPNQYLSKNPSWRFSKIQKEHKWTLSHENIDYKLYEQLQSFERMSWVEIERASGGRSKGTNNHWISVDDMCDEAKELADKFELGDELFSLRLNGTHRLFGLIEDGIFIVKWYDTCHEICPSKKKNT